MRFQNQLSPRTPYKTSCMLGMSFWDWFGSPPDLPSASHGGAHGSAAVRVRRASAAGAGAQCGSRTRFPARFRRTVQSERFRGQFRGQCPLVPIWDRFSRVALSVARAPKPGGMRCPNRTKVFHLKLLGFFRGQRAPLNSFWTIYLPQHRTENLTSMNNCLEATHRLHFRDTSLLSKKKKKNNSRAGSQRVQRRWPSWARAPRGPGGSGTAGRCRTARPWPARRGSRAACVARGNVRCTKKKGPVGRKSFSVRNSFVYEVWREGGGPHCLGGVK